MQFRIYLYYVPIWYVPCFYPPKLEGGQGHVLTPKLRSSIVITIALYLIVGVEIAKRRRILRSISEDIVPPAPAHDSCANSSHIDDDETIPQSADESVSPTLTSKYYTSTARINPTKASSLSFRQYILMPLFFFLAMLLVWVAPSTNRVATFINPSFFSYQLNLVVGVTGSLRGFWNGIVFVVVGMRSWKRRKESDEMALRPRG